MCRVLVVNDTHDRTLDDTVKMFIHLLDLRIELETSPDFSSASASLQANGEYDILLAPLPVCCNDAATIESAVSHQQNIKKIFLSESERNTIFPEQTLCVLPSPLSISNFYDVFSRLSPETVERSSVKRTRRWFTNHDALLNRILNVLQIIREEYMDDISLDYLAGRVYLSPCYLSTTFTKFMGINPMAYVNQLRMDTAVQLLLNTDHSVTDICQLVGYRNLPYFCTCFKNKYNMTPAQFPKLNGVCVAS